MTDNIVELSKHRPMNGATRRFMDAVTNGELFPDGDNLIAYACEPGKRLRPFVLMLARHGVVLLSDLEKYREDEFFKRFYFPDNRRATFLDKVYKAGAKFAPG